MFKFSPIRTSVNRFFISPNCTCEFTTPSSNSSLYASLASAFLVPTCNLPNASLNALPTTAGFSKNIPLPAEKPVAENKFLKCVTGASIVLATCDAAFGNNTKFL
jgi:hypothetical protein